MILELYHKLSTVCDDHIVVKNHKLIYLPSGEPHKLRIYLTDGTFIDAWISLSGKYSFHWDRRYNKNEIYRFDNAPHHKYLGLKTFPDHLHLKDEKTIQESDIPRDPIEALKKVLNFVLHILNNE